MAFELSTGDLPFDIFQEDGEKIKTQYIEALEWLKSLGLPVIGTRLGKYKKVIESFGENAKILKDDFSAEKIFHEFLNAHMEAVEVIRIYKTLLHRDFSEFSDQLKKVAAGQAFRNRSKDSSRDFMFELTTASRFIKSGFEVQLNQLADVVVIKEGFPKIFVECKRIKSQKKIRENVKKANEQLKKRISLDKSSLCKGVVALNVNELINPDNDMIGIDSVGNLQRMSSGLLESFVEVNKSSLEAKGFNKCLGVLVEATMQGYYVSGRCSIINCRGAKFYQYKKANAKLVRDISMLISNQNVMA